MSISGDDLTRDAFLGGRLWIRQPRSGYRAGIDPVLLAAAVDAQAGQSVLELGTGVGTALLCLGTRVPGLELTGLEVQPRYADLARDNAAANGIAATIVTGDLARMPSELRARSFDRVIANPPYFDRRRGTPARDAERETALAGTLELESWIEAGSRRLAPRGRLTVIQRADRLPDLMVAMAARLGSLRLRPVAPRTGRAATLILVEGVKGGGSPARLDAPFLLHGPAAHLRDGDDYSDAARAVLRDGATLA